MGRVDETFHIICTHKDQGTKRRPFQGQEATKKTDWRDMELIWWYLMLWTLLDQSTRAAAEIQHRPGHMGDGENGGPELLELFEWMRGVRIRRIH